MALPIPLDDATALVFQQTISKSHQVAMAAFDRENHAMGNLAEQTRLSFLEMKVSSSLATDILNQRSASQQPQVGVVPAAAPISVFSPGATPASVAANPTVKTS